MMYNNLIETREKKGIPLFEVLEYLKVNENTYNEWAISGNIPASALVKLSEVLDCSVDCLLGIDGAQ